VLYKFTGSDEILPRGGVIMDAKGNFYGTTQSGPGNYGTLCES
jgi:hypothetical protein